MASHVLLTLAQHSRVTVTMPPAASISMALQSFQNVLQYTEPQMILTVEPLANLCIWPSNNTIKTWLLYLCYKLIFEVAWFLRSSHHW